ncbi:metal-dependent hydrolase [Aquabacterium sp. J223]|uniref:metal-dependent hydrolase n=1 Tax=Aquabacterium sp. J223 TaxID=2898431 RepID=UPI0021AD5C2B|nr:metal-dependent hydrolase [Aquabacterium sp. J223]UUX97583.1 metal-dependent hydrolase [Aquabacterium sp. J223]
MTDLTVRRLLVDLAPPFARRWNGGDAFSSAFFNALSMSFPVGEQFFIDAVRRGLNGLPLHERALREAEVQGFVGQEASHRRLHALFNAQLERQGFTNWVEGQARRRVATFEGREPRHWLAATAAYEHFTALLAEHLLTHPEQLAGAEPRLQLLWLWHAAEESEHKSTAFDLYRANAGSEHWRRRWFFIVTAYFVMDLLQQTLRNLWHDRSLFKPATWRGAWRFLFGRTGLLPGIAAGWKDYLRPDFHPTQHDSRRADDWLAAHGASLMVIGRAVGATAA